MGHKEAHDEPVTEANVQTMRRIALITLQDHATGNVPYNGLQLAAMVVKLSEAWLAQARAIEAARLAVMAYPCHTRQLAEALAGLDAEETE